MAPFYAANQDDPGVEWEPYGLFHNETFSHGPALKSVRYLRDDIRDSNCESEPVALLTAFLTFSIVSLVDNWLLAK